MPPLTPRGQFLQDCATLGVEQDADEATIKTAYRKLMKTWHPDKNSDPNAAERSGQIAEAYGRLRHWLAHPEELAQAGVKFQRYFNLDNFGLDPMKTTPAELALFINERIRKPVVPRPKQYSIGLVLKVVRENGALARDAVRVAIEAKFQNWHAELLEYLLNTHPDVFEPEDIFHLVDKLEWPGTAKAWRNKMLSLAREITETRRDFAPDLTMTAIEAQIGRYDVGLFDLLLEIEPKVFTPDDLERMRSIKLKSDVRKTQAQRVWDAILAHQPELKACAIPPEEFNM